MDKALLFMNDWKLEDDDYSGYIDGEEKFRQFKLVLKASGYSFSTQYSLNNPHSDGRRIFFQRQRCMACPKISFFGSPFTVSKTSKMACSLGKKYWRNKTNTKTLSGSENGATSVVKPRKRLRRSKKLGCPALMNISEIEYYPEYSIAEYKPHLVMMMLANLQEDFKVLTEVKTVKRYFISVSKEYIHIHRANSDDCHGRIINEIRVLVCREVYSVDEIRPVLKKLADNISDAKWSDSNMCPSDEVIWDQICFSTYLMNKLKFDRDKFISHVNKWMSDLSEDEFCLRPPIWGNKSHTFLFCYQARWQRELLEKCKSNLCLLESVHKVINYPIPLYTIAVWRYDRYISVAFFSVQFEYAPLIKEALDVIIGWNPLWKPNFFLMESSNDVVSAVEDSFPSCQIAYCPYQRILEWVRWLKKSGNLDDISSRNEILNLWMDIASSTTEEIFRENTRLLTSSPLFKNRNKKSLTYFNNEWLSKVERWAITFLPEEMLEYFQKNNCRDRTHYVDFQYLGTTRELKTLTDIMKVILGQHFRLDHQNSLSSCVEDPIFLVYNDEVPVFLDGKPQNIIKHIMDRYLMARDAYNEKSLRMLGDGVFELLNDKNPSAMIDLTIPMCSCKDFKFYCLPCVHMCAIFRYQEESFNLLPESYSNGCHFTLFRSNDGRDSESNILKYCDDSVHIEEEEISSSECDETDLSDSSDDISRNFLEEQQSTIRILCKNISQMVKLCSDSTYLENITTALLKVENDLDSFLSNASIV